MASSLTVTVVEDDASLEALRPEWDSLLEHSRTATAFSTFEWTHAAWTYRRPAARPFVLKVCAGCEPVGLMPLRARAAGRRTVLEPMGLGYAGLADYLDVLAADGYETKVVEAIVSFLSRSARRWDVLDWPELSEASPSFAAVRPAGAAAGLRALVTPGTLCWRVSLPATWPEYLARLSPSMRRTEHRARRLLRDEKAVFERVDTESALGEGLDALARLQEKRWHAEGSSALSAYMGFVRQIATAFLRRGWLDFGVLRVDDQPVSVVCGFRLKDTAFGFMSGFDEDPRWDKYSVGILNVMDAIKRAVRDGCRTYDLSRGDEWYKSRLAGVAIRNHRVRLVRHRRQLLALQGRERLKALWDRFRSGGGRRRRP